MRSVYHEATQFFLERAVTRARLDKRVTLQELGDCFVVRQVRSGVAFELVQEKLGLTADAWWEAREQYHEQAFPA